MINLWTIAGILKIKMRLQLFVGYGVLAKGAPALRMMHAVGTMCISAKAASSAGAMHGVVRITMQKFDHPSRVGIIDDELTSFG